MLPPVGSRRISQTVISARILVTGSNIWGIYLVAARYLCYMIFTGKYGNINFKMKMTFSVRFGKMFTKMIFSVLLGKRGNLLFSSVSITAEQMAFHLTLLCF